MCSCSREGFQAPQPQTVATPARLERESLGSFLQAVGGPMCSCSREGWQAPQQQLPLPTDPIVEEPAPQVQASVALPPMLGRPPRPPVLASKPLPSAIALPKGFGCGMMSSRAAAAVAKSRARGGAVQPPAPPPRKATDPGPTEVRI